MSARCCAKARRSDRKSSVLVIGPSRAAGNDTAPQTIRRVYAKYYVVVFSVHLVIVAADRLEYTLGRKVWLGWSMNAESGTSGVHSTVVDLRGTRRREPIRVYLMLCYRRSVFPSTTPWQSSMGSLLLFILTMYSGNYSSASMEKTTWNVQRDPSNCPAVQSSRQATRKGRDGHGMFWRMLKGAMHCVGWHGYRGCGQRANGR